MDLKISMTAEAWKILALGSLAGALNSLVPSNLNISTIEMPKFKQNHQNKRKKLCDVFDGRWVYMPHEQPSYDPIKCRFLEEKMSCKRNGRPDLAYEKWSWEANDCDIPSLYKAKVQDKSSIPSITLTSK
ncbi:Protein trichome birefringence-like 30, partial [Bienertia sinuspersici]